jgi:hypothetical protein
VTTPGRTPLRTARGVDPEQLAAEALDGLHLDPLGAAEPAGRLDRAHVTLERLGAGQLLQILNAALDRLGLGGLQQWPGGQLGPRVGPPQRRAPLLAGGGVEALEHRPHLLGARHAFEAAGPGAAADEPTW